MIQIRREKVSVKQAFQQSKVNINISILMLKGDNSLFPIQYGDKGFFFL